MFKAYYGEIVKSITVPGKSGTNGAIAPQILGILHYLALYGSIFGLF